MPEIEPVAVPEPLDLRVDNLLIGADIVAAAARVNRVINPNVMWGEVVAEQLHPARRVRVQPFPPQVEVEFPAPNFRREMPMDKKTLAYCLGRVMNEMFGYELEVEGACLPPEVKGWNAGRDGSLRGESAEYVLRNPQNFDGMVASFEELVKSLTKKDTRLDFSFRTSTHVHLNVLNFTKKQIQALVYLSHLVEDLLVNYSGATRVGNRFCLRTKDAEHKIEAFKQWLAIPGWAKLSQEELKYSAINIATIMQYGSIEFRSLRGTIEKEVVIPWLSVIKNLHDIAAIVPINEMEEIARKNPLDIINVVFKEHLPLFQYTGMEKDVADAYDRLIEIPYVTVK